MTEGRKAARKRRARSVLMGFFVIAGLCSAVNSARGEIIVGWNFNAMEQGSKMLHADVGVGEISLEGLESDWEAFQGTPLNAIRDWVSGEALGLRGWAQNDSFLLVGFESYAVGEVSLSMATRRSSTGFTHLHIDALGPSGWVELGFKTIAIDWRIVDVPIPVEFLQEGASLLRLTISGATTSQGTVRFDNVRIDGTVVPGPGSVVVLVPTVLLHRRLRSRRC